MNYIAFNENLEGLDIKVSFLKAQEKDHYCHTINKARYEDMLLSLPEGAFKKRVQELLDETDSRLTEVTAIIESTKASLPSALLVDASLARILAKEEGV